DGATMPKPTVVNRALFRLACSVATLWSCSALCAHSPSPTAGKTRTYCIAADEVDWDYAPLGRDEAMGHPFDELQKWYTESGPHRIGNVYKKALYREYTDASFSTLKPRPAAEQYLGALGPILRGEVGDTIKIIFKNNGSHSFSMHPHGVFYQKHSE